MRPPKRVTVVPVVQSQEAEAVTTNTPLQSPVSTSSNFTPVRTGEDSPRDTVWKRLFADREDKPIDIDGFSKRKSSAVSLPQNVPNPSFSSDYDLDVTYRRTLSTTHVKENNSDEAYLPYEEFDPFNAAKDGRELERPSKERTYLYANPVLDETCQLQERREEERAVTVQERREEVQPISSRLKERILVQPVPEPPSEEPDAESPVIAARDYSRNQPEVIEKTYSPSDKLLSMIEALKTAKEDHWRWRRGHEKVEKEPPDTENIPTIVAESYLSHLSLVVNSIYILTLIPPLFGCSNRVGMGCVLDAL